MLSQTRGVVYIEPGKELQPLFCISSMYGNCSYIWRKCNVEPPLKDSEVFYSSPVAYPGEPGEFICEMTHVRRHITSAKVLVKQHQREYNNELYCTDCLYISGCDTHSLEEPGGSTKVGESTSSRQASEHTGYAIGAQAPGEYK